MSLITIFLKLANLFFILCYLSLVVIATQKLLLGDYLFLRLVALAFFTTQLVGHVLGKSWALKMTAAILGGLNIIFLIALIPFPFEPELKPVFFERFVLFFQWTMATISALILYSLRKKLK
ncbi:MAG: hypothetical protein VSS52_004080 [Thiotrichaceae bacterium]|nr:hypothetical protein [Thiotrichaceae bacterium]